MILCTKMTSLAFGNFMMDLQQLLAFLNIQRYPEFSDRTRGCIWGRCLFSSNYKLFCDMMKLLTPAMSEDKNKVFHFSNVIRSYAYLFPQRETIALKNYLVIWNPFSCHYRLWLTRQQLFGVLHDLASIIVEFVYLVSKSKH